MPLARSVLTVQCPDEPGTLASVEIIITDDSSEGLPRWLDLRESGQAGWWTHNIGSLMVAIRAIDS